MRSAGRTALRLGAVMCLLGVVVLAVVAVRVDPGGDGPVAVTVVDDPSRFTLPDAGLFGSEVTVYGDADTDGRGLRPADLGCRLVDEQGGEQSRAKMSELQVLGSDPVVVDEQPLAALFAVDSYPSGARVECSRASSVAPVAVSAPSTFGSSALAVRALAAGGAVVLLVVGLVGLILTRRPRSS